MAYTLVDRLLTTFWLHGNLRMSPLKNVMLRNESFPQKHSLNSTE